METYESCILSAENKAKFELFVQSEIDTEFETNENGGYSGGFYVIVFDLTHSELVKIREFENSLWVAEEQEIKMETLQQISENIAGQFDDIINSGKMSLFEIELNNEDCLLVELSIADNGKGLEFSFDTMGLPCSFDGEIVKLGEIAYMLPFDVVFDSLDHYLEQVMGNLQEGFLLPNGLV